jgi:hypothetical protein
VDDEERCEWVVYRVNGCKTKGKILLYGICKAKPRHGRDAAEPFSSTCTLANVYGFGGASTAGLSSLYRGGEQGIAMIIFLCTSDMVPVKHRLSFLS